MAGGETKSLFYAQWSIPGDLDKTGQTSVAGDRQSWAQANPALGIRGLALPISRTSGEAMASSGPLASSGWR